MGSGCVAWAGHLTSLSLGFSICKMGIRLLWLHSFAQGLVSRTRCGSFYYNHGELAPPRAAPHSSPVPSLMTFELGGSNEPPQDARTSEQEGTGGTFCPSPSRGWARPRTTDAQAPTLSTCSLDSGPPLQLCPHLAPFLCLDPSKVSVGHCASLPLLFLEEFPIPSLCPPQRAVG